VVLTFPYSETVAGGHAPQAVHMMDNNLRIFYIDDSGDVKAMSAAPPLGIYDALSFSDDGRMSADSGVADPNLKKVPHCGAYGFWSAENSHRFVMYMLPIDISAEQLDGSVQYTKDSPVSQISVNAQNVGSGLMGKYRSSVTPGSILSLVFTMGDSPELSLGTFYSDRVSGKREAYAIAITGRNSIGKLLLEQTFDDENTFTSGNLRDNLLAILEMAAVENYFVADTALTWNLTFDPATSVLDGIQSVVQLIPGWKISENADGTVGIGPSTDGRFDAPSTYTFQRDSTCWSCDASQDDQESYSRVCIQCANPVATVFRDLPPHKYWPIAAHKTLYVNVPEGTTTDQMNAYADTLEDTIPLTGRVETFAGIFTPHLMIGDSAEVVESDGSYSTVGTVTTVEHHFGRSGFYTQFTVDSGGRIGKPMLKDYLSTVSGQNTQTKVTIS